MEQIPGDVVIDILSRLPIKPLMRCRCVCKTWLNLTLDPRFTRTHLSRSSQSNPNLILSTNVFHHNEIYFVEQNPVHSYNFSNTHFSLLNFKESRVVGSCNGLLCLVHRLFKHIIHVCNPFTGECIKLPDPISPFQKLNEMVIGFGFIPKTHEYKVVQIVHNLNSTGTEYSEVFVFTLGDESWRYLGDLNYTITRRWAPIISVNGALHWVCTTPVDLIVSFHIVDEVFDVIPHPEFGQEEGCFSLGLLNGCLSITDSSFIDRVEIWVMEDYGLQESWNKCFAINIDQVGWNIRFSRTICFQKDGKLLLLYNNQALLLYDPQALTLRKLSIDGFPSWFDVITHVASLVSPSGCLGRDEHLHYTG